MILLIVLFPPSVLALISNNAVPGDVTYPIKRKLEDGILLIVSMNPATRAWFSANRSTRRFDEARILIAQGKQTAGASLEELVSQTAIAAKEIDQVSDPVKKEQLKQQLTQSIEQYNQGLNQIQKQVEMQTPAVTPVPNVSSKVAQTPKPVEATIQPTPTVLPTVAPMVLPTPQPAMVNSPVSSDQLGVVQKQLKEIQKDLHPDDLKESKEKENKTKENEKDKSDKKEVPESKGNKENGRLIE